MNYAKAQDYYKIIHDGSNSYYKLLEQLESDSEIRNKIKEALNLSLNTYEIFNIGKVPNIDLSENINLYRKLIEIRSVNDFVKWFKRQMF